MSPKKEWTAPSIDVSVALAGICLHRRHGDKTADLAKPVVLMDE